MQDFSPIKKCGSYLPLEDYGLIGDGATAALVGRNGAVEWLCVPRFDSRPLFCRLLDADGGGSFTITLDHVVETRQSYEDDTAVLTTELRGRTGTVRLTDCFPLRSGSDLREDAAATRRELLRQVKVLHGQVRPVRDYLEAAR
jgi:GH15 family glucan-1,4-alpha-glucosidase